MDAPETEHAHYRFNAKDAGNGTSMVTLEDVGNTLSVIGRGTFSLELKKSVSPEQAIELATQLNELVETVAYLHPK